MKPFRWNHDKNEELKKNRGISYEEIVLVIEADGLLDELQHPNPDRYLNQSILVVTLDDYVYLVPNVEESDYYFLKTVIPSRSEASRPLDSRSSSDCTSHRQQRIPACNSAGLGPLRPNQGHSAQWRAKNRSAMSSRTAETQKSASPPGFRS